jgi:3-isopropylmalate dehydratase small subunit
LKANPGNIKCDVNLTDHHNQVYDTDYILIVQFENRTHQKLFPLFLFQQLIPDFNANIQQLGK